jgi:hypothetical protein
MADSSVEFQLKLQDQMTASLRSGAENALKLDQALVKLTSRLEGLEKEEKKEQEEEKNMFAGAVEKGELLKDLIEKIAEKVFDLGKELAESAVEISDFGFKAEVALRHLNGETEESSVRTNKMLAEARQFALDAALPVESVTEAFLGLRRAGLSDEWARPLTAAAGDLAALTGHPENFRQLVDVFENISLKGQLTGRSLMALTSAGVSPAALAAKFGAKDFRELQEELTNNPIGALEGLRAIEDVIKETAHEKTLGDVLKEDASTIGGSITKIKDIWTIVLDDVLNKKDSAFGSLREDFSHLVDELIANLPLLEKEFTEIFDPVIKAIDNLIKNPTALKDFFTQAESAIKGIADIIGPIIHLVEWIGENPNVIQGLGAAAAGGAVGGLPGALIAGGAVATFGSESKAEKDYRYSQFGKANQESDLPYIGSHADGGPISQEGMAHLHAGEYVIPAGGAIVSGGGSKGNSIVVNLGGINVTGGHDMTESGLKLMLEDLLPGQLVGAFEKLAATVGTI